MRESKGVTKPGGEMKVSTLFGRPIPGLARHWPARRWGWRKRKRVAGPPSSRRASRAPAPHGARRMQSGAQAEDLSSRGPTASSRGIPLAST